MGDACYEEGDACELEQCVAYDGARYIAWVMPFVDAHLPIGERPAPGLHSGWRLMEEYRSRDWGNVTIYGREGSAWPYVALIADDGMSMPVLFRSRLAMLPLVRAYLDAAAALHPYEADATPEDDTADWLHREGVERRRKAGR